MGKDKNKRKHSSASFGSPKPPNVEPDFGRFEDIEGLGVTILQIKGH